MIEKLSKLNKVLLELLVGIIVCGLIFEGTGIWFVVDKMRYSIGLLIGILIAIAMSIHMAWALDTSLEFGQGEAEKKILFHNMLRYLLVVLIIVIVIYTGIANPLASFLGVMSLKVAAYLQPITHRLMQKIQKNEEKKASESKV